MKKIILKAIRFYQKFLSLDQGYMRALFPAQICRFRPTCSEYTYQAIERYGILSGTWFGVKRILRCGPWTRGGFDPVP